MQNFESHFRWSKSQRIGVLCLLGFVLLLYAIWIWGIPAIAPQKTYELVYLNQPRSTPTKNSTAPFDPNQLTQAGWEKLGFSPKQAQSILRYKASLGGAFSSAKELQDAYVISPEKWNQIKDFVRLDGGIVVRRTTAFTAPKKSPTHQKPLAPFDPNVLDEQGWIRLGFSPRQAQSILRYKSALGGQFLEPENLQDCYVISDEKFQALAPYVRLSKRKENPKATKEKPKKNTNLRLPSTKIDANAQTQADWLAMGFSPKQVKTIWNYKKSLGGNFPDWITFSRCYALTENHKKQLESKLYFATPTKNQPPKSDISNTEKASFIEKGLHINQIQIQHILPFVAKKKVARTFVNYRKSLGGFRSKAQIRKVYGIQPSEVDSLLKYYPLPNGE